MNDFRDLTNNTVSDILRMGYVINRLMCLYGDCSTFTSANFDDMLTNIASCDSCTLQTLRKHRFIKVHRVTERKIFTVRNHWDVDVVDMTVEQYNNLPDYFKSQVEIETRKTNHYILHVTRCKALIKLVNDINESLKTCWD